jgi:hypothetical protein
MEFAKASQMSTSQNLETVAKILLRAFIQAGARAGDLLRNLPDEVNLPGTDYAIVPQAMEYAAQRDWTEQRPGDQYLRLTPAGFAAAQSTN